MKFIKDDIINLLDLIEKKYNVKILFAIENGSRAWRIESKDSDYDVRFVYTRKMKDYLSIKKQKEVIECTSGLIDCVGFDIHKFMRLLSDSNPTCIEWLISDIIWYGNIPVDLKDWAILQYNPKKLFMHYRSLVKDNYKKYIESGIDVTKKRYLCIFRAMINANWIVNYETLPPINFEKSLNDTNFIGYTIRTKLNAIIKDKKEGKEKTQIERDKILDGFIENFLKDEYDITNKPFDDLEFFNEELRKLIYIGWIK